jgi:hypothetical protein
MRRVVGMGRVFARVVIVMRLIMRGLVMRVFGRRLGGSRLDRRCGGRAGLQFRDRGFARGVGAVAKILHRVIMVGIVIVLIMRMIVIMTMRLVVVMGGILVVPRIIVVMLGIVRMRLAEVRAFRWMRVAFIGLGGLRGILAGVLDDAALDAVAMAATARIAMARAATVAVVGGAVLALFLGLAVGALVGLDQRLTVGDRDLIVVRVDFAERQEAVAVAAIFDERRLQRRFYARDLGEINIAAQLLALGGLEIKFFDAIAADHNDPGLFRVGGVDQHLVGHFGTLDGGGRGAWRAQIARPGDATVHLIRG